MNLMILILDDEELWVEKLKELDKLKAIASEDIKEGLFEKAIRDFEKSLNILNNFTLSATKLEGKMTEINSRKASCLNNIALCYMQQNMPDRVIEFVTKTLEIRGVEDTIKVKALIRRGKKRPMQPEVLII